MKPTELRCPAMSQVTVTLPDGSSRAVPAGTSVRDVAEAISPRLAKAALAGIVDGTLVDLTLPARARTPRSGSSPTGAPEALHAVPAQHRAPAGGGGHQPVSRTCSAASVRRPTKGSSTTSSSRRPFVPEDLDAIEKKMRELAGAGSGLRAPDVAARGGQGVLRRSRRAAQGAADRREDRRPDARSPATPSRTRTPSSTSASARTCRPPASSRRSSC